MIRNVKNVRLLLFLLILIIVYVSIKLFNNTDRSRSFREELVQIDTSRVTRVLIDKSGESFEVVKEDNDWKVTIANDKKVDATASSVRNALGTLMGIEPSRIATRDPEKWKDYQVDTAGTRVRVFEEGNNTLDLIIGRFGVQGQRQFHTFVRLYEDDEVYAADNFMGISFPSVPNSFRNSRFLEMATDSISQITFQYPADSAFILSKMDTVWYIGSAPADSASVAEYLSDLRFISATEFVDDVDPSLLINPELLVEIETMNAKEHIVEAYRHPDYTYIYHSSYNPNAYFSDERISERIFASMEDLLNPPEE